MQATTTSTQPPPNTTALWIKNGIILITYFLSWASCCVAFGGSLHEVDVGVCVSKYFYDRSECGSITSKFKDGPSTPLKDACKSGGDALVFFAVWCFLLTMIAFLLRLLYTFRRPDIVPRIGKDLVQYLKYETFLFAIIVILQFLMLASWSACYDKTDKDRTSGTTLKITGYMYIIFVFIPLFLPVMSVIWYFMKRESLLRLTIVATQTPVAKDQSYNHTNNPNIPMQPQQGGGGQYPQQGYPPTQQQGYPQQQYGEQQKTVDPNQNLR